MDSKQEALAQKLIKKGTLDPDIILVALNSTGGPQISRTELVEYLSGDEAGSINVADSNKISLELAGRDNREKLAQSAHDDALKYKLILDHLKPFLPSLFRSTPTAYTVVSSKTQIGLSNAVAERMAAGWVPFGGVSAAAFGISPTGGNQYIQALVRYE